MKYMTVKYFFYSVLLMLVSAAGNASAGTASASTGTASASVRDTISLDRGWQFHRGDVSDVNMLKNLQANDEVVNLPHDFLIGQDRTGWLLMPANVLIIVMQVVMFAAV